MNPNNSNSVFVNSDSIFHEEPGFRKAKTLSKISMISRSDYRLLSYLKSLEQRIYFFFAEETSIDPLFRFASTRLMIAE
jgi:hypothetical protein